jgi:hypothetical protein
LYQSQPNFLKKWILVSRRYWVQQGTYLVITWYLLYLKQGASFTASFTFFHRSLVGQKRRRLGKEYREGTQGCIFDTVTDVFPGPVVGQLP